MDANWPEDIYAALKQAGVGLVAYVPDAGHAALIARVHGDPAMRAVVLTTEEEGIALAAGAWLGGTRAVLLMQSSGVGNCINMLSLIENGRFPFVALITMRGEWAEFNQWQVPMSRASEPSLKLMGLSVLRADRAEEVAPCVAAALDGAFKSDQGIAVLLGQRLIGRKEWK